ncbi:MAG: hypothetical protein CMB32_06335 [Euryarchaeota archaeon]|nr:hypothetical protein [Euryarchaeota archaeon]|tara:strand:- start:1476 stop:1931 length:456 start_codon:yes stop_codon:yes gene_type:complete
MPLTSNTIAQVDSLISSESNNVANMANISAHLMTETNWHWIGFYIVDALRDELVLGPFQGPVACTRLKRGKGVCAKSWETNSTVVIPNVHEFEGHVACSSLSNSEIVIPVRKSGRVVAVLDIDSIEYDDFSSDQQRILENIVKKLEERWVD